MEEKISSNHHKGAADLHRSCKLLASRSTNLFEMLKQTAVFAGSLLASAAAALPTAAQIAPPNIEIGGVKYEVDFKFGVLADNILELESQPWYKVSDFTPATQAAGQVYDCADGTPFQLPQCETPFNEFGNITLGFGGLSPWFVYDVSAGAAAVAVGFSDITDGGNVLGQINTSLLTQQPYAIATAIPDTGDAPTESIPEPSLTLALFAIVGTVAARSFAASQQH